MQAVASCVPPTQIIHRGDPEAQRRQMPMRWTNSQDARHKEGSAWIKTYFPKVFSALLKKRIFAACENFWKQIGVRGEDSFLWQSVAPQSRFPV
jgi:hypothetical protein